MKSQYIESPCIIDCMVRRVKKLLATKSLHFYLLFGLLAFSVEYLSFVLLVKITLLLVAQSISFLCGLVVSFLGNRTVTFKASGTYEHTAKSQLWRYVLLASINLLLSNGLIYLLVENLDIFSLYAKIMVMVLIVTWNYIIFNKIIFRKQLSNTN